MRNFLLLAILFMVISAGSANAQNNKVIDTPQNLTKADFLAKVANYKNTGEEWKYLGDKPCIIDFYADWCAPCRKVAPILAELAKEYKGEIYVYKINVDKEKELAADFGVSSIPTLIFCPIGENPQVAQGALPKADLIEAIETVLLKKN